jgi:hypothetical protein
MPKMRFSPENVSVYIESALFPWKKPRFMPKMRFFLGKTLRLYQNALFLGKCLSLYRGCAFSLKIAIYSKHHFP